jgi:hypothetical protein
MHRNRKEETMRTIHVAVVVSAVLVGWFAADSFAARGMKWMGSGGWGSGGAYHRMYNPQTVESITGEVVSVEQITPTKGMSSGVHLMLKTEKETISVHLGPVWYIENQDVKIEPKDSVGIKGSRVTFEGKPAIIAAEVKKGGETLTLRDDAGLPVWSGWRR